MREKKRIFYILVLSALVAFMPACSSEDNTGSGDTTQTLKTTTTTDKKTETKNKVTTKANTTKKVTTKAKTTKSQTTKEKTTTKKQTTKEEKPEKEIIEYKDDLFVMPKDGQRPVAVMIDNGGDRVLPQGGPGLAQIVYEVVVEGGITRIMPIYWGRNIKMIGPVRSTRHYYLDYMKEYDAFIVHFGWSPQAKHNIQDYNIESANGTSNAYSIFWDITSQKGNWQDTYTNSENIKNIMSYYGFSNKTDVNISSKFYKTWVVPKDGDKCTELNILYSNYYQVDYKFNPDNGLYLRYRQKKPHMERNTESQIQAGNIVIMHVNNYSIKGDNAGRQELETTGTGDGYYITAGKIKKITWSKKDRFSKTVLKDESGENIVFNPARTWIQIVPMSSVIKFK